MEKMTRSKYLKIMGKRNGIAGSYDKWVLIAENICLNKHAIPLKKLATPTAIFDAFWGKELPFDFVERKSTNSVNLKNN